MSHDGELIQKVRQAVGDDEFAALQVFWTRALADSVPERVDALYVFGQMPANENEPLACAAEWFNRERTDFVAVPDQRGRGNPAHVEAWVHKLKDRGLDDDDIVRILATDPAEPNTMTESTALVATCIARGWRTIGITAAVFHLPRAFATIISEMCRARAPIALIKIYAVAPHPGDWTAEVTHSNGRTQAPRAGMIWEEQARMASYKNIRQASELLRYLDARDR